MPRDAYLVTREPITLPDIIRAGAQRYPDYTARLLEEGVATQLVDPDYRAVVTVLQGRSLLDGDEVARLVPRAPAQAGPVWLTQAFVPWSDADAGLAILSDLALATSAVLIVEDAS